MAARGAYRMFGLTVWSSFDLEGLVATDAPQSSERNVIVDLAAAHKVEQRFSGATSARATLSVAGAETIEVVLGRLRDLSLRYGRHAFHISADGSSVLCGSAEPDSAAWRRVLLDTVLGTAALVHGLECLHACAVELAGGVVAISAATGGGKSTLCAELMRRGARLFADDLVFLARENGNVVAQPGPPLMNLPAGTDISLFGRRLAALGDEAWVAVSDAATAPGLLTKLVLLDRRSSFTGARLEPEDSALGLISAALDSGPWPDRRRSRFGLLGDLARDVEVLRLVASPDLLPAALAELIESTVEPGAK